MIRFPNRFHASNTPDAVGVIVDAGSVEEPITVAEPTRSHYHTISERKSRTRPKFDFSTIIAVLG